MTTPIHFVVNRKLNTAEVLTGAIFRHWEMVQAAFHVGIQMADGNSATGIGRCKTLAEFQRKAEHGKTTVLENRKEVA